MKAIRITTGNQSELTQVDYSESSDLSESWLQGILFDSPVLLNQSARDQIDPIIPLCRELPLRGATNTVYLDLLCVRGSGRPVLVECKLWRNPQARREVIGQILEYAALLQGQSYSDVEAILRTKLKSNDTSIWSEAKAKYSETLDEADFCDHFSECLIDGTFDLILAGDGIRSDVSAIVSFLESQQTRINSIECIEVKVFTDGEEQLVVAQAPVQISATRYRQTSVGGVEEIDGGAIETQKEQSPRSTEKLLKDRKFWDKFIAAVRFSHSEQARPRHGGRNWVKIPYFPQVGWITCFRLSGGKDSRIGLFMTFTGDGGEEAYSALVERWDELQEEVPDLEHTIDRKGVPEIYVLNYLDVSDPTTEEHQLNWITKKASEVVDLLTPIFLAMSAK